MLGDIGWVFFKNDGQIDVWAVSSSMLASTSASDHGERVISPVIMTGRLLMSFVWARDDPFGWRAGSTDLRALSVLYSRRGQSQVGGIELHGCRAKREARLDRRPERWPRRRTDVQLNRQNDMAVLANRARAIEGHQRNSGSQVTVGLVTALVNCE